MYRRPLDHKWATRGSPLWLSSTGHRSQRTRGDRWVCQKISNAHEAQQHSSRVVGNCLELSPSTLFSNAASLLLKLRESNWWACLPGQTFPGTYAPGSTPFIKFLATPLPQDAASLAMDCNQPHTPADPAPLKQFRILSNLVITTWCPILQFTLACAPVQQMLEKQARVWCRCVALINKSMNHSNHEWCHSAL